MDIAIHNLTRTFGTLRANDTISLHFAAGKIHGILGENGAGKSTLMKLLAGFLQPDDGQIYLDDHQVSLDSPADALRAGIGMVYQEPLDVPAFTALENFFCASPRNRIPNRTVARQQLLHFAAELDFPVESDARIASLTIGQRQQLEIIRLLAAGARLLILDEPTTGITATQKAALFAALRRLATEGKTVLFVSHKLDEVDELCDTASVLRGGQVMGEGQMTMPQKRDHLLGLMFGQHQHQPTIAMPLQSFVPSLPHPVWRLQHVSLRSGNLSLHDISLDIRAGMVLGLAGVDGSGQQLLLHMLAGLIHPDEGTVLVNGKNMTAASLADYQADGVQYVPADRMRDGLISSFSLTDHIALYYTTGLLLKNRQEAQSEAQEAIAEYDIRATPTTPMEDLSGGNQQRAMLALLPPRCTGLLLEQPTRGLDVASAGNIWQRLQARCADGTALVFTSPDLDELIEYSDSVLVFYSGRVSRAIPRAELNANRLAEMIGGIGFAENERPLPF
jgi:simple sugar transport system ATP-binding protein